MTNEAAQFAGVYDRIALEVLSHLESVPESSLYWPPPIPGGRSLFSLTMELFEESEFWVLVTVGGQESPHDDTTGKFYPQRFSDLIIRYQQWLIAIHDVLDELPDAHMNLNVVLPPSYHEVFGAGTTTVRDCLLHSLGQTAIQAGHIQFLCRMFSDGKRLLGEVIEADQMIDCSSSLERQLRAGDSKFGKQIRGRLKFLRSLSLGSLLFTSSLLQDKVSRRSIRPRTDGNIQH